MTWVLRTLCLVLKPSWRFALFRAMRNLPTTSALGSFVPEKVSLPSAEVMPVQLSAAMGPDGQSMVEDFIYDQVLSEDGARSKLEASGIERCYTDPKLRSQTTYEEYVDRLRGLGLVDFSVEKTVEEAGIFFVKKKGDRLRMILDCRRSNCWFKEPKGVKLTTGESLSKIRVKENPTTLCLLSRLGQCFLHAVYAPAFEEVLWTEASESRCSWC